MTKPPIWAVLWPSVPRLHCSGGTPLAQLPKKSRWNDSDQVRRMQAHCLLTRAKVKGVKAEAGGPHAEEAAEGPHCW